MKAIIAIIVALATITPAHAQVAAVIPAAARLAPYVISRNLARAGITAAANDATVSATVTAIGSHGAGAISTSASGIAVTLAAIVAAKNLVDGNNNLMVKPTAGTVGATVNADTPQSVPTTANYYCTYGVNPYCGTNPLDVAYTASPNRRSGDYLGTGSTVYGCTSSGQFYAPLSLGPYISTSSYIAQSNPCLPSGSFYVQFVIKASDGSGLGTQSHLIVPQSSLPGYYQSSQSTPDTFTRPVTTISTTPSDFATQPSVQALAQEQVSPALLADYYNYTWAQAGSIPSGYSQNQSYPVTASDVTEAQQASGISVNVADFVNPYTSNDSAITSDPVRFADQIASNSAAPATNPNNNNGSQTSTSTTPTVQDVRVTNPSLNVNVQNSITAQVDFGTFAGPTLQDVNVNTILDPLFNLWPDWANFAFPPHTSTCPTPSFQLWGQAFVFDQMCTWTEMIKPTLQSLFALMWVIVSIFIVMGA